MRRFLLILAFFALSLNSSLKAQTDTLFWFVAPEVSQGLGDRPVMLYFNTYAQASTVTISLPAHGTIPTVTKNIAANSLDSLDLTAVIDSIENKPANTVNNQGILIQSTQNISSYYMVKSGANKEIFTLKGQKGIGKDFFTPFQEMWGTGVTAPASFSSIEIVATQNNTTVLITPRNAVTGHVQNTSFSVLLNRGQTFSAQNTNTFKDSSLAGSIISSNNPIAVTVYSGAVSNGGCLSTLGDQLTTSAYIGNSYVINQGNGSSEGVFVLATQNNTAISFTDGTNSYSNTINWSETDTFSIRQPLTYISSTKPIYVWHVTGYGCKQSAAQVPAIYCSGTYSVAFNRATNDSFAINLYTRNGYQNNFLLNGVGGSINGASFNPVPGTSGNIMAARIYFTPAQIAAGTHNTISNTGDIFGCAIHNGSSTAGAGYGYISEFTSYPFINAGPDATICSNSSFNLFGQVGGGNVQGTWTSNGFGTFTGGSNALNNTYQASPLDTLIKPVQIILTTVGPCTVLRDTVLLTVTPQPLVNAGADQTMCASNPTVTLSGNVSLGSSTGIWSTLGTGTFSPSNTQFTPVYTGSNADTSAGQVTLILTSTNNGGCAAVTDTMKITITNAAGVNAGPASTSVCANNNAVTLNGTLSGSGTTAKWTSSGTGVFTPDNLQLNATYHPSSNDVTAGSVILKLTTTNNGQCKVADDSITVTFTTPPIVTAGSDMDVCENTPVVTLNGSVSGATTTGIWSGGSGTFSPSNTTLNAAYTPTASEITGGVVVLTLTSTNNATCLSENDAVQLNFRLKPFANFSFTNTCLNVGSSFTDFSIPAAGSLASWDWNFGDGATASGTNPSHTYGTSAAFTVTLVVKNTYNCYDTAKKVLSIYPLPSANFGITRNCGGSGLNLAFHDSTLITAPDTISSWYWDFGGLGSSTQQNPTQAYPNAPTSIFYNVTLIVRSNHNCKDTAHQTFNLTPLAQAGFYYSFNQGQSVGTSVSFTDTSKNAVGWSYTFGDSPPGSSVLQDPIYLYSSNGNFIVTQVVRDAYGCTDTARKVVKINNVTNEITQLIPNAISPNGDGKNDIWHLDFIRSFYPNALIEIFNRWGEKVFSSVGYNTAWDGTFNGSNLPVASYYYVITLNDSKYPNPFKGSVLLIR
jgi:gliding motility-associated-like protein